MIFIGCIYLHIFNSKILKEPLSIMMMEGEDRPSNAIETMHLISNVFIWYGFMDNRRTIERVVLVVTREPYWLILFNV